MSYFVFYPADEDYCPEAVHPGTPGSGMSLADINPENYRDLIAFVSDHPDVAKRVLIAANAAIHGHLANRITSVDRAVLMLGIDRVSGIAQQPCSGQPV